MQVDMDICEGGVWATCGTLEPEKSFWYIISFRWTNGTCRYTTVAETPPIVSVDNADGNRITIEWLEIGEAWKKFGVPMSPDGNTVTKFERLLEESHKWASQIKPGNLRKWMHV
jgi:hypothetical protein